MYSHTVFYELAKQNNTGKARLHVHAEKEIPEKIVYNVHVHCSKSTMAMSVRVCAGVEIVCVDLRFVIANLQYSIQPLILVSGFVCLPARSGCPPSP